MLTRGRWLDEQYQNWQPSGCMMHDYQIDDLATCLRYRKAVFVGDSITRQVFWATAQKLGLQSQGEDRHADLAFSNKGVTIEFIWDPYLNSSSLYRELTAASLAGEGSNAADTAAILLIGGGLWHARYLDKTYFASFEGSIQDISQTMSTQDEKYPEMLWNWPSNSAENPDSLVVTAPVPIPVYKSLTPSRAQTLTPDRINPLNLHLQQVSWENKMQTAWSYTFMTSRHEGSYQIDGLHVIREVASIMADVLLNIRCNAALRGAQTKVYPMDKTCCNVYEKPNRIQAAVLNGSMGLLPFLVLVTFKGSKRLAFLPSRKITRAITVLALAVCYCYYADRTQLFNKAQKQYKTSDFVLLCSVTLALGILSIRRSAAILHNNTGSSSNKVRDQLFLSRHQTDEWKGWMQFVILIYHYTGASKILWIYEIVRLLVASYLFMSGFGHTLFFYKRADYSLSRCATVLIRLNMLSCILPYVMRTDYLFYYFAPLISFWYLVIFFTMVVGHSKNHDLAFLTAKILTSAAVVTALIKIPQVFGMLFYLLEMSCGIHWDVTEWRFRLQLDSYIVYLGMLCGILFIRVTDALRTEDDGKATAHNFVRRYFYHFRLITGICALLTPPIFVMTAHTAPSKQIYNSWVPYVSIFPILAFVVLRNFSRHGRNFHSSMFAWMGRHSLETFTLQFHIWLAADTKGLLALGILERAAGGAIDERKVDMPILTIIFLWVSWHVGAAIQTLTSWLVDPREGKEENEVDEETGGEREKLPRSRSTENTKSNSSIGRVADRLGAGVSRSVGSVTTLVAGDLRTRLAIIFGTMWLLNITSR